MAKVIKIFKTLRNHWKKSTFFSILGFYGIEYGRDWHKNYMLMREFSSEALMHGKRPLPPGAKNKHITLLLNPTASNRKSKSKLEKYSEPLLHLSGFLVYIVKTERIDEARDLVGVVEKTNIIAIAGGDGSLFETVTGLLRRDDVDEAIRRFPVAIIPLGHQNNFSKKLFNHPDAPTDPKCIAEATMAIIRHKIRAQDVMEVTMVEEVEEIQVNEVEQDTEAGTTKPETEEDVKKPKKPFYALAGISVGQFREAYKLKDEMPSFFPNYFSTFWSLLRTPEKSFQAEIRYVPPCDGCLKCYKEKKVESSMNSLKNNVKSDVDNKSIWSRIFSIFQTVHAQAKSEYSESKEEVFPLKDNSECGKWTDLCIDTSEINIVPGGNGRLRIEIGNKFDKTDFMIEGLKRNRKDKPNFSHVIECQELEIIPRETHGFFSIDNEEFETKRIRIKCLKERVYFFAP